jgi:hypothetical protein
MPLELGTGLLGLGDAESGLVRLLHPLSSFGRYLPFCHAVLPHFFLLLVICPAMSLADIDGENNRKT